MGDFEPSDVPLRVKLALVVVVESFEKTVLLIVLIFAFHCFVLQLVLNLDLFFLLLF